MFEELVYERLDRRTTLLNSEVGFVLDKLPTEVLLLESMCTTFIADKLLFNSSHVCGHSTDDMLFKYLLQVAATIKGHTCSSLK